MSSFPIGIKLGFSHAHFYTSEKPAQSQSPPSIIMAGPPDCHCKCQGLLLQLPNSSTSVPTVSSLWLQFAFSKNNFQLTAAFLDVFAVRHLSRPSFFFFLCTTNLPLQSFRTFSTINRSRMLRVNCGHLLKFQGLDFYTVH